ncbi:MAG TPA: SAM-dependent methyltransferase [Rhodobacteraceae bacterium]|nr:SAM-dependent methyltransferase [Paracoccaceae bacterium]
MQTPPQLTDRAALQRFRARVDEAAMFLQEEVRFEIKERLKLVNRTFTSIAIVTPFPKIWKEFSENALILPDEEILALELGAHDLVIHAMALHWANDPVGQLIQCQRALKPDGLFLGACFGGETLTELRVALTEAEVALTGGLSPRILPMGEIRELGALLQRAGFALPVADTDLRTVSYSDMFALLRDLRDMGEGNALAQRRKVFTSRELFTKAAEIYAANFALDEGRIKATFEMIYLTGWAPDESQPKPLRPGSATARLADALNTQEISLPDSAPKRRI